ncbi:MAG TPA: mechanosensitive ion channel domain-containing protein [Woeseiaceae bacterium]|nr:mechanosensitive ion channel domain-containing protein [Woeseiaceae bacterium]
MNELTTRIEAFGRVLLDFVDRPAFIAQFVIIVLLFAAAYALAWWAEPKLEARAREIKGYPPGLLRLIVVVLRRLKWAAFVALLTVALVLVRSFQWPASDRMLSSALLLALAWLVISVVSTVLRSRLLGRLFAAVAWIYVATAILGITDEVGGALEKMGLPFGDRTFNLLTLLKLVFLLGVLLWLAFSLGNFLDHWLRRSEELTPSLRILFGKILRVTLVVLAALFALSSAGIDITVFAVFAGALGVGIGFGLQKVVSNFISGILILLDRSIEPGDTISVGQTFGWVKELRARFVSVITRDGREYLIPNEDFLTQQVINWSFSDDLVRLDVRFGVSYSADPHRVRELAMQAAKSVDRVIGSKPPVCWLAAFGESSLDFLLRFWIRDPQHGLSNIQGTVLLAVWDKLTENGIQIPFPHREILMKTPVEVKMTGGLQERSARPNRTDG